MPRAQKGTISIHAFMGMLRLRLPRQWYNGKLKFLCLGLPDNKENQKIALTKANLMTNDYIYGKFDFSLKRYKLKTAVDDNPNFKDLFEKYMEAKSNQLTKASMKNLSNVWIKLSKMPESILNDAKNIKSWLLNNCSQEQARRHLIQLNACCNWAIENSLVKINSFERLSKIKKKKTSPPDPFSRIERDLIINEFEEFEKYFSNFVKFLFFTGCRPSEAIALSWEDINFRDKKILFSKAIVAGEMQTDTKTKENRFFPINEQLNLILRELKKQDKNNTFIFLSKKGKNINLNNFNSRIWIPILKKLKIRHRGIYHCRHTFITACLNEKVPIQQVAKWAGNSPAIILKHYAGISETGVPNL